MILVHRPANLLVHKVAAHCGPHSVPLKEVRHVLGNQFVDTASKAARLSEMPWLYDLLTETENRQSTHEDMLEGYLQYQTACATHLARHRSMAEARTEERAAEASDSTCGLRQWLALEVRLGQPVAMPAFHCSWLAASPWPPYFTSAVWRWAVRVAWPPAQAKEERLAGVTWLELLVDFIATEQQCPPLKLANAAEATVDAHDTLGKLHGIILKDITLTFVAAIRFLEQQCGAGLVLAPASPPNKDLGASWLSFAEAGPSPPSGDGQPRRLGPS